MLWAFRIYFISVAIWYDGSSNGKEKKILSHFRPVHKNQDLYHILSNNWKYKLFFFFFFFLYCPALIWIFRAVEMTQNSQANVLCLPSYTQQNQHLWSSAHQAAGGGIPFLAPLLQRRRSKLGLDLHEHPCGQCHLLEYLSFLQICKSSRPKLF